MGQSRDSDLAVWPAKRARFLGTNTHVWCSRGCDVWHHTPLRALFGSTKHACMVFAGGCDVWRHNPLRPPFWGIKRASRILPGPLTCARATERRQALREAGFPPDVKEVQKLIS